MQTEIANAIKALDFWRNGNMQLNIFNGLGQFRQLI